MKDLSDVNDEFVVHCEREVKNVCEERWRKSRGVFEEKLATG